MFQISRANYNKSMNMEEKINTPFSFEKEIYIDRHLLKNKEELSKYSEEIEKIENEIKLI